MAKEQADVIVNITGNIISGQVMGETSKLLSERFGKIMQDRRVFLLTVMIRPSVAPHSWMLLYLHQRSRLYRLVNLWEWLQMIRMKDQT